MPTDDNQTNPKDPNSQSQPPVTDPGNQQSGQQGQANNGQSSGQSEDWKARYIGLSQTLTNVQTEKTTLINQLTAKNTEADTLKEQNVKLQEELAKLTGEKSNIDKELTGLKFQTQRMKIVAENFPQFLQMEAQGLLPSASNEEEFKAALTKFGASLGMLSNMNQQQNQAGASTPPAGNSSNLTKEQVFAAMYTAQRSGNTPEYEKLYQQWVKL